jgi:hypothetical protein
MKHAKKSVWHEAIARRPVAVAYPTGYSKR